MTTEQQQAEVTPFTSLIIVPANIVPSPAAQFLDALAYEPITQGQAVAYLEPRSDTVSTPYVRLADAGTYYKVIGIAAGGASPNQPLKVILDDPALALGVTAAGDVVYLGPTSGSITVTYADLTSGKFVSVLGIGIGGGKINLNPVRSDVQK